MKTLINLTVILIVSTGLVGCATQQVALKPSKVTLQDALKSVGEGLAQMKEAEGNMRTGLIPSGVTVTFNVSASSSDTNGLYVSASIPIGGKTIGAGGSATSSESASRANTITISFTNILLLTDTNTFIYAKSPDCITNIFAKLGSSGPIMTRGKEEQNKNNPGIIFNPK